MHRTWSFVRHNAGVASLVIVCCGIAGGFHALNRESEQRTAAVSTEARERSAVDQARTAQLKWDKAASDNAACVRQAESRVEVRNTFDDVFASVARFSSPDRRAEALRFTAAERAVVGGALPDLDCPRLAPLPKGPRPVIPTDGPFRSCAQARVSGATPLRRGDAGYSLRLDSDGDGIACE